ncbi:MAG: aminomethyl-transferring glycine dehydrogenase [Acidobacteriota bacterium]
MRPVAAHRFLQYIPFMQERDTRPGSFVDRHIGPRDRDIREMLSLLGLSSLGELADRAIPAGIRTKRELHLPEPLSEHRALELLRQLAQKNRVWRSLIGQGYYDCVLPAPILRNILENPGWYTQYTPYQAEISQGRLEALLNFQTMVADLTGLPLANASLLDEATAAAEAMHLAHSAVRGADSKMFFAADHCHPQTLDVVRTRAKAQGIRLEIGPLDNFRPTDGYFGALFQYPATDGALVDLREILDACRRAGVVTAVATDLLALTLLEPPGRLGADVAVGSTQRFGVPLGFGGPHAAFLATHEEYKRLIPGRIVGVSRDRLGRPALRLAMQTREQHIRRERATSNICTAQVLPAILASMYAVYHGPEGLRAIAERIHGLAATLADRLEAAGMQLRSRTFFDTLTVTGVDAAAVRRRAEAEEINLRYYADGAVGLSFDELSDEDEVERLAGIFGCSAGPVAGSSRIPPQLRRTTGFLEHPVFHDYRSETEFMRYVRTLQDRDLSLTHSMIPLGSCTMKLNAAAEMLPITWPEWSRIHPFAPLEQAQGYLELMAQLEEYLAEITGMDAVSLQPNSGAQGEFAGLTTIAGYLEARGESHRRICLIPQSAHGTNPASAVMAGFQVVVVRCRENGDIDVDHLRELAARHAENLGALMVTYPSTHGVFEDAIQEICEIIHAHGGQVYMDGANLNAMVGLCRPGEFGVDVCHLNLHKTFAIPHGGGGPGVGPIAVKEHLRPFLPGHFRLERREGAVAAAPWGSPNILPISWMYIRMMGAAGLRKASLVAILNANYIAQRLDPAFPVLYRGRHGFVAHECILDCRRLKRELGITVFDIAKRLMDYGFHAPTVSFPVVETLMVEPTESESRAELDRFCEAMLAIHEEIEEIRRGDADLSDNPLKNAPHTAEMVAADEWPHPYSREKAAFPVEGLRRRKFWTPCARIDEAWGDRHLFCTCPRPEEWAAAVGEPAGKQGS